MRFITVTSILCVFIAGCRKPAERFAELEQGSKNTSAIHERRLDTVSSSLSGLEQKVSECNDVDSFVSWLSQQHGVADVQVNKKLLLTSDPPQVVVLFMLEGVRKRLLLFVEPDTKLRLIAPKLLQ